VVSKKIWVNLLLWGLGDRLEKLNDYKTDILMVVDIMLWFSLLILAPGEGGLLYWVVALLNPASSIVVQLLVGYLLVRGARRQVGTPVGPTSSKKEVTAERPASGPLESEEP
jgi:hypothetical protein